MKNEAINIDEWISHYLSMGAGRIFLIDNGSTDDTLAKARVWVAKGVVELVEYPERHRQKQHYWKAFRALNIAKKCEWLLVADLDEFWFCPSGQPIAARLADFLPFDVIYANWRIFGSSGLQQQPVSVRQGFTRCSPELAAHTERKYLCRTAAIKTAKTMGVHTITGACSSRTISDNHSFHLNHYPIQSVEFFQKVKMTRGGVSTVFSDTVRDMNYFNNYDAPCTAQDHLLANLVATGVIT